MGMFSREGNVVFTDSSYANQESPGRKWDISWSLIWCCWISYKRMTAGPRSPRSRLGVACESLLSNASPSVFRTGPSS